jgi:hypothetical protein
MRSALTSAVARALGRTSVPLAAYYGITIGVPLINGSGSADGAFLEHMAFVAVFPLTTVGLVAILGHAWRTGVAFGRRPRETSKSVERSSSSSLFADW